MKKRVWGKRGLGHVEIVLSFIIFVTAVGFALYFFSPTDSSRLVESTMSYAFREIMQETEVELDVYGVKITNLPSGTEEKIMISYFNNIVDDNKNVRVELFESGQTSFNVLEDAVMASVGCASGVSPGLYIEKKGGYWINGDFIYIKFSEDFVCDTMTPPDFFEGVQVLSNDRFQITSSTSRKVISEKEFRGLVNRYKNGYSGLKRETFNLPNRIDFGFELVFNSDKTKISTLDGEGGKKPPSGLDTFVETKRVEVIRSTGQDQDIGKSEFADLSVIIW